MKTTFAGSNQVVIPVVSRHRLVRRILLACGLLAALTWLGTDLVASLSYAGYRYPFDPISGLSAIGAPTRPYVNLLLGAYLGLKIVFASGIWITTGHKRALRFTAGLLFVSGLVDLAAFFFPWRPAEPVGTLPNIMHAILAGGLNVLLILLTIGFGAGANGKWFRRYSYGTLLVMLVIGALPILGGFSISADQPPEWFGASERINAYGFMLWLIVLASLLLRTRGRYASLPDS